MPRWAPASPTTFDAGGFQLQQDVVNLGLTRNYKTVLQGLNVAAGGEGRREWYSLFAGEERLVPQLRPANAGRAARRASPASSPRDEIKAQRDNVGVYVDAELSVTQRWLLAGGPALRELQRLRQHLQLQSLDALQPDRVPDAARHVQHRFPGAVAGADQLQLHLYQLRERRAGGSAAGPQQQRRDPEAGHSRPEAGNLHQRQRGLHQPPGLGR